LLHYCWIKKIPRFLDNRELQKNLNFKKREEETTTEAFPLRQSLTRPFAPPIVPPSMFQSTFPSESIKANNRANSSSFRVESAFEFTIIENDVMHSPVRVLNNDTHFVTDSEALQKYMQPEVPPYSFKSIDIQSKKLNNNSKAIIVGSIGGCAIIIFLIISLFIAVNTFDNKRKRNVSNKMESSVLPSNLVEHKNDRFNKTALNQFSISSTQTQAQTQVQAPAQAQTPKQLPPVLSHVAKMQSSLDWTPLILYKTSIDSPRNINNISMDKNLDLEGGIEVDSNKCQDSNEASLTVDRWRPKLLSFLSNEFAFSHYPNRDDENDKPHYDQSIKKVKTSNTTHNKVEVRKIKKEMKQEKRTKKDDMPPTIHNKSYIVPMSFSLEEN